MSEKPQGWNRKIYKSESKEARIRGRMLAQQSFQELEEMASGGDPALEALLNIIRKAKEAE